MAGGCVQGSHSINAASFCLQFIWEPVKPSDRPIYMKTTGVRAIGFHRPNLSTVNDLQIPAWSDSLRNTSESRNRSECQVTSVRGACGVSLDHAEQGYLCKMLQFFKGDANRHTSRELGGHKPYTKNCMYLSNVGNGQTVFTRGCTIANGQAWKQTCK